ncbi:MAG: YeeE/YedE family protein [Acidobacteria bacterium]|nr:YeeE/YedE family protein [Acidobacteriota bacterium]
MRICEPATADGHQTGVIQETFNTVFRRSISIWAAALLLATLNILLFAYEKPWTAADGLRNWGDWFLQAAGWQSLLPTLPPSLYSGSVLNAGLLAGAVASALLSRQFALQIAPPAELAKGLLGGVLMGVGAVLAMGCNVGGFYSALSAMSLSGVSMMVGLGLGAWLGVRYMMWEMVKFPRLSSGSGRSFWGASGSGRSRQPWMGGLCLLLIAGVVFLYSHYGFGQRGGLLLIGVLLGTVLQRSRFCLVRAFRDPFLDGNSEMTRVAALSLAISAIGFAILKSADLRPATAFVFASFWKGSLVGGAIFGLGMVLAGGCGAGALWRAGEGHIKLWCALMGFAFASAVAWRVLEQGGWLSRLGTAVFLPDVSGWPLALAATLAVLAIWYVLAAWNERTRSVAAM